MNRDRWRPGVLTDRTAQNNGGTTERLEHSTRRREAARQAVHATHMNRAGAQDGSCAPLGPPVSRPAVQAGRVESFQRAGASDLCCFVPLCDPVSSVTSVGSDLAFFRTAWSSVLNQRGRSTSGLCAL